MKKEFIRNQRKIDNKKTSKEERKLLIAKNREIWKKFGNEGK